MQSELPNLTSTSAYLAAMIGADSGTLTFHETHRSEDVYLFEFFCIATKPWTRPSGRNPPVPEVTGPPQTMPFRQPAFPSTFSAISTRRTNVFRSASLRTISFTWAISFLSDLDVQDRSQNLWLPTVHAGPCFIRKVCRHRSPYR